VIKPGAQVIPPGVYPDHWLVAPRSKEDCSEADKDSSYLQHRPWAVTLPGIKKYLRQWSLMSTSKISSGATVITTKIHMLWQENTDGVLRTHHWYQLANR